MYRIAAWTTSSGNSAVFGAIKDPNNNVAIGKPRNLAVCCDVDKRLSPEMHQYLDSDGSGTSPTCVSSTIGAERLQAATQWLQQNNLKGFLGEIGAGSNRMCAPAQTGDVASLTLFLQRLASPPFKAPSARCNSPASGSVLSGGLQVHGGARYVATRSTKVHTRAYTMHSISNLSNLPAEPLSPPSFRRLWSPSCESGGVKRRESRASMLLRTLLCIRACQCM